MGPTVQSIVDRILAAIHSGGLRPGTIVRDVDFARDFGLSRTPVREAFQVLREAGVLEVSASRYTRIAVLSPRQTDQARRAWMPLQEAVLEEILAQPDPVSPAAIAQMEAAHAESVAATLAFDNPRLAAANAQLYATAVGLANNPFLSKALSVVAHALRLGLLSLPESLDLAQVLQAQRETIDAIAGRDREKAAQAMATLRAIRIPGF